MANAADRPGTDAAENARGAGLMVASMAAFTINDTFVKAAGASLPLGQILMLRGLLVLVAVYLLARRFKALRRIPARDAGLMALRSLAEIGAAFFFLTALLALPLANVTAILQTLPLTVTLGAALFLGEEVGWRRWAAIGVGFLGMLLIVRPGTADFTAASVYVLVAVACVTLRDLVTRRMSREVPSLLVTLAAAGAVTLFAAGLSLVQGWAPLTPASAGMILGSAGFVSAGYLLSVMVMRVGDVSAVAPFRFTGLLWALALGFLVFGDWPEPLTLVGAALVVGAGVFTLRRERKVKGRV
ncbi:DMT family transporter [Roseivivax sp.]